MNTTVYGYDLLSAGGFEDLLAERATVVDLDAAIDLALRKGRVLLQGAGGTGKTFTLRRIQSRARERGLRVGYVQVQRLHFQEVEHDGFEALLRAAEPGLTYEDSAGDTGLLLLVDGLSEVDRALATLVVREVDRWAALAPSTGSIIADRLVRREVGPPRWGLLTLGPVSPERVEELLGRRAQPAEAELLGTPALLELALKAPKSVLTSRSSATRRHLDPARLESGDLDRLAGFALGVYVTARRRTFGMGELVESVGEDVASALTHAGVIVEHPRGERSFAHHLIHDYLAARAVSQSPEQWTHDLFEALTLRNSSHDALVMLMEQVDRECRDYLVRRVYDWNLYAAAYLLAMDTTDGAGATDVTEHQVLALLGERRFDFFLATRRQVEDALAVHDAEVASKYLVAASPEEAHDIARSALPGEPDYQAWLDVFLAETCPAPRAMIELLTETDGVMGWTVANVIRRLGTDEAGTARVQELAHHPRATVRWRSVHVLGASRSETSEELFRVLVEDPDVPVRYGALRSIVEQAYRAPDVEGRWRILAALASQSEVVRTEPALRSEFRRLLEVQDPPLEWAEAAAGVIERCISAESDPEELDRWRRVGAALRLNRWDHTR